MNWSEVRLEVDAHPDDGLLLDVVAPMIASLRERIEGWHHLWEPDLWVRIRWRSASDAEAGLEAIRTTLDGALREGRMSAWRFAVYDHDADVALMGPEMVEAFDDDLQRGAEHALKLLALERREVLTKDRDFHWARQMHTSTNQLYGTWADEYRLCLEQARYRAWLLSRGKHTKRDELTAIVTQLDALLGEVDAIASAEDEQLDAWRSAGRPEITALFDLPTTFSRKPSDNR